MDSLWMNCGCWYCCSLWKKLCEQTKFVVYLLQNLLPEIISHFFISHVSLEGSYHANVCVRHTGWNLWESCTSVINTNVWFLQKLSSLFSQIKVQPLKAGEEAHFHCLGEENKWNSEKHCVFTNFTPAPECSTAGLTDQKQAHKISTLQRGWWHSVCYNR